MFGSLNKLKKRPESPSWLQSALLSAVFLAVVVLVWPHPAYAIWDTVMSGIAQLLLVFAGWIGWVALQLIGLLVEVAQFNNFIHAPAVERGWVIVRDVANMFFIVILLLIAFGSVFRIEEYQYKKVLGKLLIMAVLVNFSKSITGFFIDISQVVMLTFVNGFKEAAAGNFVNGFHIADMFEFAENGTEEQAGSASAFLGAAALALITIIITTIVVAVYLVVFLLRIIALWFLTIISPIAYLLSAFPGDARKYSSQWWDYFGKYATTGPILAFFLWLSLAVMQFGADATSYGFNVSESEYSIPAAAVTKIGQADVMLSFIINIILLMGGLWMTQQLGVAGGKLAGSAFNKIQGAGATIAKSPFKAAWGATKLAAKSANQSIVKATKGRVSLDVRDYAKAFKTAREDRRREAYQQFAGRKEKFFKQWGSPTGAAKLVLGAPSRWKASAEAKRLSKEDKELKSKLKSGHKGQIYRQELQKEQEELKTKIDSRQKRIDKLADDSPLKDKLVKEQQKDEVRNKRVGNLLGKGDKELSSEYKDRINAAIRVNERKMSDLHNKMVLPNMSDEEKLSAAQLQFDLENEANLRGLKANKEETKNVTEELDQAKKDFEQAESPEAKEQIGEAINDLRKKLTDIEAHRFKLETKASQLKSEESGIKEGNTKVIDNVAMRGLAGSILSNKKKEINDDISEKEKDKTKLDVDIDATQGLLDSGTFKNDDEKNLMKQELSALKEKKKLLEREQAELKEQQRKIDELMRMDPFASYKELSKQSDKEQSEINEQLQAKHNELASTDLSDTDTRDKLEAEIKSLEKRSEDIEQKRAEALENMIGDIDYEKSRKLVESDDDMKNVVIESQKTNDTWGKQYETLSESNVEARDKRDAEDITSAQAQEINQQLQTNKQRMSKLRTSWYQTSEPADYYVERERRRNVAEELKKVTSENSDELLPEFEKAVASKNESLAMAVAMKLSNDANLNELLNHYNYKSNFEGLNKFRKEVLEKQLGLDDQAALQYQNDLSFAAERVNHWDSARTVGYDTNTREFTELSPEEHKEAALAEMLKIDNQVSARNFNRLAYGGEIQSPDGKRKFEISDLGKAFLETAQNGLADVMTRFNINAAKNLSDPQSLAVLEQLVQQGKLQADILRQIKERGSTKPGKPKEKK